MEIHATYHDHAHLSVENVIFFKLCFFYYRDDDGDAAGDSAADGAQEQEDHLKNNCHLSSMTN